MEPEEQENEEILCIDGENEEEIEYINEGLKKFLKNPNKSNLKFKNVRKKRGK